ncbi:MAG: stage III sporulation protein AE [Clostridia bacterium]|nr:stage III sporulation protein AE [Clostridia bacterium]
MKRKVIWLVFFLFLIIRLCTPISIDNVPAAAEGEIGKTEEALGESVLELIGELDLQALEEYVASIGAFSGESVAERLVDYIKGESFDYENFGREIVRVLFENVGELLPAFACIAAITLLSGLISTLKSSSASGTAANMIFLISYAAALIPLIGVLIECFEKTFSSVSQMQKQMQLVYPLLLTLMAASGGTLSVAMCRPAVAFFSNTIVSLITSVVFPLTVAIVSFSMAGNLTKELKISKFCSFFKSINKWVIGVSVSVFGLFFTLQGLTSATYDGVVRRAAKYAIGSGIPIVGGFLSGGFDLAVAGSILIKNSLGSMSIFLMISVLFEPIVTLISVNLLLRFTAAITQPFGDSRISDFLGETADNLHYCTAGLLFTAFLYFISIVLIVSSSEALF